MPSRVRSVTATQVGLARALWWGVRGRADVGPGELPLHYNGPDRVLLYTITTLGVLETAAVHVLVSWAPLRWPLLALGIYGLLGFVAFDCTLRQHPHLLRAGELVLRFGHFRSVSVPLDRLAAVRKRVQNGHRKTVEVDGDGLALSFMGGTNVELRFSAPVDVEVDGGRRSVTRVSLSADDPGAAVALLRTRVLSTDR
jgi:hypothetical protein